MSAKPDPVVEHAQHEAIIIGLAWAAATAFCCWYSWMYGYSTYERPLSEADVHPIAGIGVPSWVFWGYLVPWGVCTLFTFWFAGFYMKDDDLGSDHTVELEADIREGAEHHA